MISHSSLQHQLPYATNSAGTFVILFATPLMFQYGLIVLEESPPLQAANGHHQVLYHHPPPHTSSTIQKDYFNNAEVYHLRSSVKPRSLVLRLSADTFKVCRSAFLNSFLTISHHPILFTRSLNHVISSHHKDITTTPSSPAWRSTCPVVQI